MTYYVCRCPHLMPAKVWTAQSEQEVIDLVGGDTDNSFDTALDAARHDVRDGYVTDDPFDLWLWINGAEAPQATGARGAFLRNTDVRLDVEAVAVSQYDSATEEETYSAFDGRFVWSVSDEEWRLGNQPPIAADDLVQALCAASLVLALDGMEQADV